MKDILIVFIKFPEPGTVKTRLASVFGDEAAAALYRRLVEITLARTDAHAQHAFDRVLCFDPIRPREQYRCWLPYVEGFVSQQGDCLGERMCNAFRRAFAQGYQRVALIGSDCPDVSAAVVQEAFRLLDTHDAVLGPARDGGYYLMALGREFPRVFEGIDWGTDAVLRRTLERLDELGAARALLPVLRDVDRPDDVCWYRRQGYAL